MSCIKTWSPVVAVFLLIGVLWYGYFHTHWRKEVTTGASIPTGILLEVIFFHVFLALLLVTYFRAMFAKPGTIPNTPQWKLSGADGAKYETVTVETKRTGQRRHCKWCAKYKPDRTHHCRVCNACVLKMDHHCIFINNCVGFYNHKFFFLLIIYTWCILALMVGTMIPDIKDLNSSMTTWDTFVALFTFSLAVILLLVFTVFDGLHIYLMLKGMTTIEYCEKNFRNPSTKSNMYSRGCFGNVRAVLGNNPLFWLVPFGRPRSNGLSFPTRDLGRLQVDLEANRSNRSSMRSMEDRTERESLLKSQASRSQPMSRKISGDFSAISTSGESEHVERRY